VFEHVMRDKESRRVFVECRSTVVYVDPGGRPKRLTNDYVEKVS
jgi:acyl-CoA thioesterase FadM